MTYDTNDTMIQGKFYQWFDCYTHSCTISPTVSLLHKFSLKSVRVGGLHPPNGSTPPAEIVDPPLVLQTERLGTNCFFLKYKFSFNTIFIDTVKSLDNCELLKVGSEIVCTGEIITMYDGIL